MRTGSLELRRITTRQTIPTITFDKCVRTDFYELYWADLSGGSTWDQVKAWVRGLLLRNPFTRVPRDVFLAWIVLWLIALTAIVFSIAAVLAAKGNDVRWRLWEYAPLLWLGWQTWQLGFGRRHGPRDPLHRALFRPRGPHARHARRTSRRAGAFASAGWPVGELHNKEYARIVVVGHSLGSILAYDLVSYF